MKRTLLVILLCAASLAGARAQTGETHVSVRAGEERLECLLTESQKSSVTHLTVTGTLRDEDYAYLRGGLLARLKELDLRDADIDTIPAHAFDVDLQYQFIGRKEIILPQRLLYVAEYGLWIRGVTCEYVLTGKFPDRGGNAFYGIVCLSSDNDFCEYYFGQIYSADGEILHYYRSGCDTIRAGTRVIGGRVFENVGRHEETELFLPATLDSVGDRAFANRELFIATGISGGPYKTHGECVVCEAVVPPKLGKDVFLPFYDNVYMESDNFTERAKLYVPDGSVAAYRNAEGWSSFRTIKGISQVVNGIRNPNVCGGLSVDASGDCYVLRSRKPMRVVDVFSAGGVKLLHKSVDACLADVPKAIISPPLLIPACKL